MKDMYRDEFRRHMEAGDDAMNAKLRIIEQGCPVEVADEIEAEEGVDEDDEDEPTYQTCVRCGQPVHLKRGRLRRARRRQPGLHASASRGWLPGLTAVQEAQPGWVSARAIRLTED